MKTIASNITRKNEGSTRQLVKQAMQVQRDVRYAAHQIGVNRQIIRSGNNRKNRADAVPANVIKVVQDFYKSSEISTERPELRFRGKFLLMMPLS